MKILYSHNPEERIDGIKEELAPHEVIFHPHSLQEGEWNGEGIEILSVFVSSKVGETELAKLPQLKLVTTRSTGFDHIDVEAVKKRGVAVATVPDYGSHTVAEFAFSLLLYLARNLEEANRRVVVDGSFDPQGLTGFELFGKTLGVLGTGKIGRNLIKIAQGFGMKVVAFDAYPDYDFARDKNFAYLELEALLASSDIVSLHLPENTETHHILNQERIAKMKKGAVLINTARGTLLDTEALVWGLEQGIIKAAGLDVLAEEGFVADEMRLLKEKHPEAESLKTLLLNHYLIDHPRVLITPHTAFNTEEALERITTTTIQNILNFARGEPTNLVP